MSDVVNPNPFDSALLCTSVHLPVQVGFCHREDTVSRFHTVQALDIVLHFFTEKDGHLNDPVALGRLGFGDNILALDTLIRFRDGDGLLFKFEVPRGKGQQFCFCQYKSKKNLLLIRKKHHCFHPVMLPANNLI